MLVKGVKGRESSLGSSKYTCDVHSLSVIFIFLQKLVSNIFVKSVNAALAEVAHSIIAASNPFIVYCILEFIEISPNAMRAAIASAIYYCNAFIALILLHPSSYYLFSVQLVSVRRVL